MQLVPKPKVLPTEDPDRVVPWVLVDGTIASVHEYPDIQLIKIISECERNAVKEKANRELRLLSMTSTMDTPFLKRLHAKQIAEEDCRNVRDYLPDWYYEATEEANRRGLRLNYNGDLDELAYELVSAVMRANNQSYN
jgi:hypothetical protein